MIEPKTTTARVVLRISGELGHAPLWDPPPAEGQPHCPHGDGCPRCEDVARWTCGCGMTVIVRGRVTHGRATGDRCPLR